MDDYTVHQIAWEQWRELKETITEMRDNDGTGIQQDVCKFLVNYMDVLEKQMVAQPERMRGRWEDYRCDMYECSECGHIYTSFEVGRCDANFCPVCGADMRGKQDG